MRVRLPICHWFGMLSVLAYLTCAAIAYVRYPLEFSPANNWLSDLGNPVDNPRGAFFYNAGVVLTAFFIGIWFAGLAQWRLTHSVASQRLLAISQVLGVLSSVALVLSALNPINRPAEHAFWSQLHYLGTGIAFAFSVAALRYHRRVGTWVLCLGAAASVWPSVMLALGRGGVYWMEWVAVSLFILYFLLLGSASRQLVR